MIKQLQFLYLFIAFFLGQNILAPRVMAGVYQCINEHGVTEYRDSPCKNSAEDQSFLPVQYSKTNVKNAEKQLKTLEQTVKKQVSLDKKQHIKKVRGEKQKIKTEAKEKRRQEHCVRVKEKIVLLEDQLKKGVKLKSFERLKLELEHQERMKKRYCDS